MVFHNEVVQGAPHDALLEDVDGDRVHEGVPDPGHEGRPSKGFHHSYLVEAGVFRHGIVAPDHRRLHRNVAGPVSVLILTVHAVRGERDGALRARPHFGATLQRRKIIPRVAALSESPLTYDVAAPMYNGFHHL